MVNVILVLAFRGEAVKVVRKTFEISAIAGVCSKIRVIEDSRVVFRQSI